MPHSKVPWTLDLLVVSSNEEGTGHAQSLPHRTPSPRLPQRRARSPSSMEYRLGGHMKAVGPRQTACRLLPAQVPANMVTDDIAHYQVAISRSRLLGRVRMPAASAPPRAALKPVNLLSTSFRCHYCRTNENPNDLLRFLLYGAIVSVYANRNCGSISYESE